MIDALREQGFDAELYAPDEPAPAVLVLSKRFDPDSLATVLQLRTQGTRVVLDLCDNLFHADPPSLASDRRKAWLRDACEAVDAVIVSTDPLRRVVREAAPNVARITVIGDAFEPPHDPRLVATFDRLKAEVGLARLRVSLSLDRRPGVLRLLWFGHHGSAHAEGGMLDLMSIVGDLNDVGRESPLSLTVISNHLPKFEQVQQATRIPCFYLPWHRDTFSRAVRLHHTAVLPVRRNPFTDCKTNNRVATALIHGLAVMADPIPSYEEFAPFIGLGDWRDGLRRQACHHAASQAAVLAGQRYLREHWSSAQVAATWAAALADISPSLTTQRLRG